MRRLDGCEQRKRFPERMPQGEGSHFPPSTRQIYEIPRRASTSELLPSFFGIEANTNTGHRSNEGSAARRVQLPPECSCLLATYLYESMRRGTGGGRNQVIHLLLRAHKVVGCAMD